VQRIEQPQTASENVVVNMCRPFVVVIGGAKVADKLGVLTELMQMADKVIVGGRMAFTFLAQKGVALGKTHIEADLLDEASNIIKLAEDNVRSSLLHPFL
jgi:3-phosphoglycerate kinase